VHEALAKPAFALTLLLITFTLAVLLQIPLLTVHVNLLFPDTKPVTLVLAEDGETTNAVPVLDHKPVPIDGTKALRTALLVQTL
jgi:hypothetical protein